MVGSKDGTLTLNAIVSVPVSPASAGILPGQKAGDEGAGAERQGLTAGNGVHWTTPLETTASAWSAAGMV